MHVSAKEIKDYPLFIRPFFWLQKRKYGQVLKPGLLWGRSPRLFATVAMLYGALDRKKSPISPILRSLVTVRVSQINWCQFCVDINSNTLLLRAGQQEKVDELRHWQSSEVFTDEERLVLEYTDAVTHTDQRVTPELISKIKQIYNEDTLVELTGLIAFQNLSAKFNAALDVPAQGFCSLPSARILIDGNTSSARTGGSK